MNSETYFIRYSTMIIGENVFKVGRLRTSEACILDVASVSHKLLILASIIFDTHIIMHSFAGLNIFVSMLCCHSINITKGIVEKGHYTVRNSWLCESFSLYLHLKGAAMLRATREQTYTGGFHYDIHILSILLSANASCIHCHFPL